MQKLDKAQTQYRWCIPGRDRQPKVQDEIVLGTGEPCRGLPLRFFGEREVERNGAGNVVATVNIGVNIPFKFSVCNAMASDPMWVLTGLPNNMSPDQPFILSWDEVPAGKCVNRRGYYYADNRRDVYYYAESFPKSGGVTSHTRQGDSGPINLCVKPAHQPVNRVNTAGYRCAPDERGIGFWKTQLNEDGSDTVVTLER